MIHTAMNYKTLYDRIIRDMKLGISRSEVISYLQENPHDLKRIQTRPGPAYIKSYRPLYPFQYWQIDHIDLQSISGNAKKA